MNLWEEDIVVASCISHESEWDETCTLVHILSHSVACRCDIFIVMETQLSCNKY